MNDENSISTETVESPSFELTDTLEKTVKAVSHGKKIPVTHELSRPSLQDLKTRDEKQPYRSQEVADEVDQVLVDLSGKVDIGLYDKLVVRTAGYKFNVEPNQSDELRKQALENIPSTHKVSIIQDLVKVNSEVVYDDSEDITEFVWSEGQTYRVRSELGGRGEFVVYSEIKEPSYRQFELYNGATKFFLERPKGSTKKPITRISVDLTPAISMFDELIENIEGMTFNGNPVDVSDKKQLAAIDGYFKRSVVDAVMKETKLDMGE